MDQQVETHFPFARRPPAACSGRWGFFLNQERHFDVNKHTDDPYLRSTLRAYPVNADTHYI
jgi:hypothetical protein